MRETRGDLWQMPGLKCITTNGDVNRLGEAVMGRGCAKEAKQRYPSLPRRLGFGLRRKGNIVMFFPDLALFTFPVKHRWRDRADLDLIAQSAHQLVQEVAHPKLCGIDVYLPRPGCGNGQLTWEEVKPVIEPIIASDRFIVIDRPKRLDRSSNTW
jgi:hypothetical protein